MKKNQENGGRFGTLVSHLDLTKRQKESESWADARRSVNELEREEQMCDERARKWMKQIEAGKEDGAEQEQGN
jgi:hypothetical protein